jgi:hypothetical protein
MRAITVRNPWAWAIAAGFKPVENRSQNANYRGPLAIHAGQAWSVRGECDHRVCEAWATFAASVPLRPAPNVPVSGAVGRLHKDSLFVEYGIIAVAELVDCHPDQGCCRPWGESSYEEAGGRTRTAIHHLVLDEVRTLAEPVPARGALGLWMLPDDVEAAVREQLAAVASC